MMKKMIKTITDVESTSKQQRAGRYNGNLHSAVKNCEM
jgi:hypothetical protein